MTTKQATRAAILAAVRAFVQGVEKRARTHCSFDYCDTNRMGYQDALYEELAALERAATEGAPEGGRQETNAHE